MVLGNEPSRIRDLMRKSPTKNWKKHPNNRCTNHNTESQEIREKRGNLTPPKDHNFPTTGFKETEIGKMIG